MAMSPKLLRRRILLRSQAHAVLFGGERQSITAFHEWRANYASETLTQGEKRGDENGDKWFTLPPYTVTVDGAILGKGISRKRREPRNDAVGGHGAAVSAYTASTTALKWVLRCRPELPRSLVQKLFRLRQVRRECCDVLEHSDAGAQLQKRRLRRVAAKDSMNLGDRIYLPITVQESPIDKKECHCNEDEVSFIRNLELYKDPAIIVVNKPPGMPVQGGSGIKRSLDELAATCLTYDYSEPPRLVHRLDRDSSGILVMGRTQTSATVLHSIFREKTFGASNDDIDNDKRILQRRYWALVIGTPRHRKGLISAPLGKVVVDNGKSDRITVMNNSQSLSSQHAITKYEVIGSSHGFTWLELSPITGRKHQLRVHCAEVLGTPIVGDYKYGWQTHKNWKPFPCYNRVNSSNEVPKRKTLPFGLNVENGNISDKHPQLHLHCKQMVLPHISLVLQNLQLYSDYDLSQLESIKLVAPLPSHMQRSWELTSS
ncbi:hypothetical protein FNV43_RR22566 [Rhamnella rubrinervis]|uniref:Pseudouridine synthase RsuA/RluA-like domain-containing protein n=1 Tax=Rhamnella rubrinervis TaxID=2594499 RepID=A0A8K0GNA9_9ROSA|nr:hypothetical protein FNV43_RR22566 [Rhamnella rubrinervis]